MTVEIINIQMSKNELLEMMVEASKIAIQQAKISEAITDEFISVNEASKIMGRGRDTIIRYCEGGVLKCSFDVKGTNKTRKISKNSIMKFLTNKN